MGTKLKCNPFELIAFESVVSEHPGDVTAQNALRDYLQDNGYSHIGARQRVARVVREALELKLVEKCKQIFMRFPSLEFDVIRRLTINGRFPFRPLPELRIWPRFQPVAYNSIPAYFEDKDGNRFSDDLEPSLSFTPTRLVRSKAWFDAPASFIWHLIEEMLPSRHRS